MIKNFIVQRIYRWSADVWTNDQKRDDRPVILHVKMPDTLKEVRRGNPLKECTYITAEVNQTSERSFELVKVLSERKLREVAKRQKASNEDIKALTLSKDGKFVVQYIYRTNIGNTIYRMAWVREFV